MGVTTEKSTEITNLDLDGFTANAPTEQGGVVRMAHFDFTQGAAAGDATSQAILAQFPNGRIRLLDICEVHSAFGAARTLDFGHYGYTQPDGTVVEADPDAFDADNDVSGAGALTIRVDTVVETVGGFRLTCQVNDATIPAGATVKGYATYVRI